MGSDLPDYGHFEAVDSAGDGTHLTVYVRDKRDGRHYTVEFMANLSGTYKPDGGGPAQKRAFDAALRVAKNHVQNELGHNVVNKAHWQRVNLATAKRVVENSAEYDVIRAVEECDVCGDEYNPGSGRGVWARDVCHDCSYHRSEHGEWPDEDGGPA